MTTDPLGELRGHVSWMARQCDHDGNYQEPTKDVPWDHCDMTWCMRCEIEKARHLVRLVSDQRSPAERKPHD